MTTVRMTLVLFLLLLSFNVGSGADQDPAFGINPAKYGDLLFWYFRLLNSAVWDGIVGLVLPCDRSCISTCGCDTYRCEVPKGSWLGSCQLSSSEFRDVTEEVLPPYTQTAPPLLDITKTPMPAGVCTLDVDRDGDQDLYFVSGQGYPNALMRNTGEGEFENVSVEWKLTLLDNSAVSCLAVDLDNDGCDDLVLTGAYTGANFTGNLLLRNTFCDNGIVGFTDETPDILRQWPYTISSSAADFDNDGRLDIFVSSLPELDLSNFPGPVPIENFPGSSLLLHNTGNFKFKDITQGSGVEHPTCPCMTILLDYDSDGLQDIIAINCGNDMLRTFSMQLYRNNGNLTFEDRSVVGGFGPDEPRGMWMGAGVGDFDQDGCLDFVSTNLGNDITTIDSDPAIFYGRCGNETPRFVGEPVSVEPRNFAIDMTLFAWGPMARDFNNDGILDMFWTGNYNVGDLGFEVVDVSLPDQLLFAIFGAIPFPTIVTEAEVLYGNGPGAEYSFRSVPLPTDLRQDYHIIMTSGDYNADGAVDIVVSTDNSIPGPRGGRPAIFYGIPNENNWLGVRLLGTSATVNRQAIGAVVKLYDKKQENGVSPGRAAQTMILLAGSGAMSTEEKTVFFGTGQEPVSQFNVEVLWPGGSSEWFDGFSQNGVVTLTEGNGSSVPDP